MAWTYGGWRREATTAAQRAMLIQHIEEVEALLSGAKSLGALDQTMGRYEVEQYLAKLEGRLDEYDEMIDADASCPPFVQARPLTGDSMD